MCLGRSIYWKNTKKTHAISRQKYLYFCYINSEEFVVVWVEGNQNIRNKSCWWSTEFRMSMPNVGTAMRTRIVWHIRWSECLLPLVVSVKMALRIHFRLFLFSSLVLFYFVEPVVWCAYLLFLLLIRFTRQNLDKTVDRAAFVISNHRTVWMYCISVTLYDEYTNIHIYPTNWMITHDLFWNRNFTQIFKKQQNFF